MLERVLLRCWLFNLCFVHSLAKIYYFIPAADSPIAVIVIVTIIFLAWFRQIC
jgi:hypothetical protein